MNLKRLVRKLGQYKQGEFGGNVQGIIAKVKMFSDSSTQGELFVRWIRNLVAELEKLE